ncbi:IclR family transcriptional regulator [Bacillus safensis]|nr:IclR family transcriptional regulator [Bacillus safensis]
MTDKSTSQTLRRGLHILDLFHKVNKELTVKEITEKMGISTTVTFRLVNTLMECGYLTKNTSTGKIRLGLNAYKLGIYADPIPELREIAMPFIEDIAQKTKETVSLNIMDPLTKEGVCIASIESPHDVKFSRPIGLSKPIHNGASRKVLLAFMDHKQQELMIRRLSSKYEIEIDRLKVDLDQIKTKGFAYTEGEVNEGALNVAVPILSQEGHILAGLSIHCPTYRKKDDTVEYFAQLAKEAALKIERHLEKTEAAPS